MQDFLHSLLGFRPSIFATFSLALSLLNLTTALIVGLALPLSLMSALIFVNYLLIATLIALPFVKEAREKMKE